MRPAGLSLLWTALTMLALLAPASQAQNHTFLVTDAGIGRLDADTVYASKDVSAALGGMTVAESKIYYDDIPIPVRPMFRCDYATHDDSLPPANVLARCPVEGIIWIWNE